MMEASDVQVEMHDDEPDRLGECDGSSTKERKASTRSLKLGLRVGAILSFAVLVSGVALLVQWSSSPNHAKQDTDPNKHVEDGDTSTTNNGGSAVAAVGRIKVSKSSPSGPKAEKTYPTLKYSPTPTDPPTREEAEPVMYMIKYVLEWDATGSDCGVPLAALGAMCGEGATLSLPDHDRSLHACEIGSTGTLSCNATSNGAVVIMCKSPDKESLKLSAHWYGDQVECYTNGTATQTIHLAALTPASSNPEDDIPVDGKLCLGNMDPAISQSRCRSGTVQSGRQSRCVSQYTCESGIVCKDGGTCGIAGVMVSTLDLASLEERGGIEEEWVGPDPPKRYTDYAVLWHSQGRGGQIIFFPELYGCREPQPEMTASCGGDGVLSILEHDLSNHDCLINNSGNIECQEQEKDAVGFIMLRCETEADDNMDLLLTVTLPGETLFCDGFLNTDFYGTGYYGGSASNSLQVVTVCNGEIITIEDDACSAEFEADNNGNMRCIMQNSCISDPLWNPWDCDTVLDDTVITTSGPLIAGAGCVSVGE